ncbi:MAG: 1-deoxy-D-xylulose-5-phosphate reductoisomerase [Pseudomonadota bacterium]|nr:1-deoxy-D-xylulose-5-phosphate reductoisomerase [Pseudomonadota bacterium]
MKSISILGSTGSIGKNALSVLSTLKNNFSVYGISCNTNILEFYNQIKIFNPKKAVITDIEKYNDFIDLYGSKISSTEILYGDDGLKDITSHNDVDVVLAAIVGFKCLKPVINAINNNKNIIIANKEILVSAGDVIMLELKKSKAKLLPIDSEHNALLQVIISSGLEYKINDSDYYKSKIRNLTITASGGPFIDLDITDFKKIKSSDAIKHPTWDMGKKISVDSSTMMNKGLEIIEAKVLFNLDVKNINAIVHRQSKIHALVEFYDGTTIAHLSQPDMKIPISYALTYPERVYKSNGNVFEYEDLTFDIIPYDKFPCYKIARIVAQTGKNTGLILNAANEISVEYFLNDKIRFVDIPDIIQNVLDNADIKSHDNIESILDNDMEIRVITENIIKDKYGTIK